MIQELSPGIYTGSNSIYNIESASGFNTTGIRTGTTELKVKNDQYEKEGKAIKWAESNHPKRILENIRKTGVLGAAMKVRDTAHFGTGLTLYKEDENGNKKSLPYRAIPEFHAFDKDNYLNRRYIDIIHDLEVHGIAFPEYVVSRDFKKITRIQRIPMSFCLFEELNNATGRIENIYINTDWENPDDNYTVKVPCFSFWDTAESILEYCKKKKIYKFIIPIYYTMDGEIYYPKPYWQAIIRNGWAKVAQSIPAVKQAVQNNQLHFKFLISISEEYFKSIYEDWDAFTPEKRNEKYRELVDKID